MANIIDKYNRVFDDAGNIKLCGREACQDLIIALSELFPNVNFGDKKTGVMKVDTIKDYISLIQ